MRMARLVVLLAVALTADGLSSIETRVRQALFRYSGSLRPGAVLPPPPVPAHIVKPEYASAAPSAVGSATVSAGVIPVLDDPAALAAIREAGRVAGEVRDLGGALVAPGVTTHEIDEAVHAASIARDCYPSPLRYRAFPRSCCISVNEVVCHGIPDDRPLADGDIVNVDVTCYTRAGYHGDCSATFAVGAVDARSRELLAAARGALEAGIAVCGPGVAYAAIGAAIDDYLAPTRFATLPGMCGHGIGRKFHQAPVVRHVRSADRTVMLPGHVFTIEPPLLENKQRQVVTWPDQWTICSADGGRSAQFEHMVLITEDGAEVLTRSGA